MAINPDCTPGWVDPNPAAGGFTSRCGCGWSAPAASRSEAKRLQREHRFPDDPPSPMPCQEVSQAGRQRPTQVLEGPFQITFTGDDHADVAQRVRDELAARPCLVAGHRPAHLTSGGVACGVCGTPL